MMPPLSAERGHQARLACLWAECSAQYGLRGPHARGGYVTDVNSSTSTSTPRRSALRRTLRLARDPVVIYAVLATVWIVVTDMVMLRLAPELQKLAWIGTCLNPADGKHYLIAYHDCCGKTVCQHCTCYRFENEQPVYRAAQANDVHWCQANGSPAVACTLAIVLGPAEYAK